MRLLKRWPVCAGAGLLLLMSSVHGSVSDTEREKLIAERLAQEIEQGNLVWIRGRFGSEFPALFQSAGAYARPTAIILLHGMGGHPDWPVVISPLRGFLHEHHWTTLSIQLPVLKPGRSPSDYGRTVKESARRIIAAIRLLDDKYYHEVFLVGYGFGAATAIHSTVKEKPEAVIGIAGISMLARKFLDPGIDLVQLLREIPVDVLDVYAGNDRQAVLQTADDRRLAGFQNGGDAEFSQVMIEEADASYSGHEDELFTQIRQWLEQAKNMPRNSDDKQTGAGLEK